MTDSKHELIAEGIRNLLASIQEDEGVYNFTPSGVYRVTFFEDTWLESSLPYLIFIAPGEENHIEETSGEVSGHMDVRLLIARRNERATETPWKEQTPSRWTEINWAVRDVLKALWSWNTSGFFGGTGIENIAENGILIDRTQAAAGWIICQCAFTVLYTYPKESP